MHPNERRRLDAAASARGLTPSDYTRRALFCAADHPVAGAAGVHRNLDAAALARRNLTNKRRPADCSMRLLPCRYCRSITSIAIIHAWRAADAGAPDYSAAMRGASSEVVK
jgi:hypothetical protein